MDVTNQLSQFLVDQHVEFETLGKKEKWLLQQRWRERFAVRLKQLTGKWVLDGIDWHVFSAEYYPSLKGARAEAALRELEVESFILISSNQQLPGYRCTASALPDLSELNSLTWDHPEVFDLYFFTPDLQWTVVFTHEQQHGPFFATASTAEDQTLRE
jgi:hypothetical protein